MHMRRPLPPRRLALAAGLAIAALAAAGSIAAAVPAGSRAEAWQTAFDPRPMLDLTNRVIVVLSAPSLADRVAGAKAPPSPRAEKRFVQQADAFQRRLIAALRRDGVKIRRQRVYTRTFNGFSAVLGARARTALERSPGVVGVYPVRAVYAASLSATALERSEFGEGGGHRSGISLPGSDGSGVTVAILDTGIDASAPMLAGRVLPGIDVVGGDSDVSPRASPANGALLETHGTRMAGIVAGANGPDGLAGVAPGATILPIRVLGWMRDATGAFQVVGRSDLLLAGLERAVDPNEDGDTADAAPIALAALSEPYAAFADGPEARAVAGAGRLGHSSSRRRGTTGRAAAASGRSARRAVHRTRSRWGRPTCGGK